MDRDTKVAIDEQFRVLRPYWMRYTAPISVVFKAANADCDVGHALGVPPDGFHVIEADNVVYRRPGPWATSSLAYLRSPNAGTRATVIFFTLRESQ